ncbi:MAG: alpha/beta fold hydrolase [Ruminococcus sp.]|nr:alpha/beta fold hydrolase [Ruminococcus sp.]
MIKSFTIPSKYDKLPLSVLLIMPDEKKPCGILQISHGMCDHKERYINFMEYMADKGYICLINDHRGHGESILQKSDLGYFYKNGGSALVDDLHQLTNWITEQYPDLPVFLLGHSMGSLAVRSYLKRYPSALDGLIVCGSPSEPLAIEKLQKVLKRLIERKGENYHSKFIEKIIYKAFQFPFKNDKERNTWICSDSSIVKAYNNDPLCQFNFSLNGYEALLFLIKTTYDKNDWNVTNPNMPIRFLSGADDPCRTNDHKFNQAVSLMQSVGYKNVTSYLFPDMRHEILNESKKELVYNDIFKTLSIWQLQNNLI